MKFNKVFIVLLLLFIPIASLGSYVDSIIIPNYNFKQYFLLNIVEYGLFLFGFWLGKRFQDS